MATVKSSPPCSFGSYYRKRRLPSNLQIHLYGNAGSGFGDKSNTHQSMSVMKET